MRLLVYCESLVAVRLPRNLLSSTSTIGKDRDFIIEHLAGQE